MTEVTLKGNAIKLDGTLPSLGQSAPEFHGVKGDLSEFKLSDLKGTVRILLGVPSLDTDVCSKETKEFNQRLGANEGVHVIVISGDLPFAQDRFCTSEEVRNITTISQFRDMSFSKAYGTHIADGPLLGLTARAVFVIDKSDKVVYSELVPEITQEPNYDAAAEAVKKAL